MLFHYFKEKPNYFESEFQNLYKETENFGKSSQQNCKDYDKSDNLNALEYTLGSLYIETRTFDYPFYYPENKIEDL